MIEVTLNEGQRKTLLNGMDVLTRKYGMARYGDILILLGTLNNPVAENSEEGTNTYSFSEKQISVVNELLDTTLKEKGIVVFEGVSDLFMCFRQAIAKHQESQEVEGAPEDGEES